MTQANNAKSSIKEPDTIRIDLTAGPLVRAKGLVNDLDASSLHGRSIGLLYQLPEFFIVSVGPNPSPKGGLQPIDTGERLGR